MDAVHHKRLPCTAELHFLELPKLKNGCDGTVLWDILSFFNVRSVEEMGKLAEKENTKDYVEALKRLSGNKKVVAMVEAEEKFSHDLASAEVKGRSEGRAEGEQIGIAKGEHAKAIKVARNLLTMNLSIQQIAIATGLSIEEIIKLR
jgi:predicted transposase/invertase (TIGR01784 family)